ncbi:MAG TPA: DUF3302 domain-containing protein [Candidatus Hydrogenedentes bacterium]|nr:DUF3302 domain-containing protein [Candidatus Hydrogenedentota bacterium]
MSRATSHSVASLLPRTLRIWLFVLAAATSTTAHASMFQGEQMDKLAEILSWVVLVIGPIAGIAIFLLIHILPEKIAEKKNHPQVAAIKTLCLLSLVFGGLLWPLAWLWAYTKPVLYKMAYGVDTAPGHSFHAAAEGETDPVREVERLRLRIAELEAQVSKNKSQGGLA